MKYIIISFLLGFSVINTLFIDSQQKDTSCFSLYNDKIPDGYYFEKPFIGSSSKTRFGIPDTSLVKIELYDVNNKVIDSAGARLSGGNYYFDLRNIITDSNFKSGIYIVILNAEQDRIPRTFRYMKFTGRTKMVIVK